MIHYRRAVLAPLSFLVMLIFALASGRADDLSETIGACGKPDKDVTAPAREMAPGAKLRKLTYNGIVLHFIAGRLAPGPGWNFSAAEVGQGTERRPGIVARDLPCFAKVGAVQREAAETPVPAADHDPSAKVRGITMALFFIVFGGAVYFLPCIVASQRKVASGTAGIVLLNIFFGWTLIGWLIALIWACTGETKTQAQAKVFDYDRLAAAMQARTPPPPPQH